MATGLGDYAQAVPAVPKPAQLYDATADDEGSGSGEGAGTGDGDESTPGPAEPVVTVPPRCPFELARASVYGPACSPGEPAPIEPVDDEVTVADLLPAVSATARAQIPLPGVAFQNLDPEFGWAYVKVAQDFRVTNLAPISVSASSGRVWVTVSATPIKVTFEPGEPRGHPVSCSPAQAQEGFDVDRPGACSYTYFDSSSISPNGRTFDTSLTVEWEVGWTSSDGDGSWPNYLAVTSQPLGVAEIQALVTCVGPRPEQGGC